MAGKKKHKHVEVEPAPAAESVAAAPVDVAPVPGPSKVSGGLMALFWIILVFALCIRVSALDKASYMIDEINVIRDAMSAESLKAIWKQELERFTQYHRLPMLMGIIRVSLKASGEAAQGYPKESAARMPMSGSGRSPAAPA